MNIKKFTDKRWLRFKLELTGGLFSLEKLAARRRKSGADIVGVLAGISCVTQFAFIKSQLQVCWGVAKW